MRSEDEIEKKLSELESSIKEEPPELVNEGELAKNIPWGSELTASGGRTSPGTGQSTIVGMFLVILSLFFLFQHVKISTTSWGWGWGWLAMGHPGFGLLILPLLLGIGFLFYDYKQRAGWVITAVGALLLVFSILSQLSMYFPPMSLLGIISTFVPLTLGAVLLLKSYLAYKKGQ